MKFEKKICQEVLILSVPGMLSNLVIGLSGFAAALMIAKIGFNVISAATLIYSVMSVLTMLAFGLLIPVTILIAREMGADQADKVRLIFHDGIMLILIVSIVPIIMMLKSHVLLQWAHQPTIVADIASHYFELMAYGFYPMMFVLLINQLLIGLNKPRTSLIFILLSSLLNLALTGLFISRYQIQGAAYASLFSYCFVLSLQLVYLRQNSFFTRFKLFNICQVGVYFKAIIRLGVPIAIQRITECIALTLLVFFMGWVGSSALSAQQVVMQVTTISLIIPFGFMQAANVLISQAQAQKNLLLIKKYIFHLNVLCLGMVFILVVFSYFLSDVIANSFLHNEDNFIKQLSISLLHISLLTILFDSVRNVAVSILRIVCGAKSLMIYSFVSLWLIAIPLSYLLAFNLHRGAQGMACGWLFGVIVGTLLVLGRLSKFVRQ
jgi:MATE family multidrug resistance protein